MGRAAGRLETARQAGASVAVLGQNPFLRFVLKTFLDGLD